VKSYFLLIIFLALFPLKHALANAECKAMELEGDVTSVLNTESALIATQKVYATPDVVAETISSQYPITRNQALIHIFNFLLTAEGRYPEANWKRIERNMTICINELAQNRQGMKELIRVRNGVRLSANIKSQIDFKIFYASRKNSEEARVTDSH
jgi:hypothetical protein